MTANTVRVDAWHYPRIRTLVIAFLCVVGLAPTVQAQGSCVAPPGGLVGWWPGDGNANTIVGTNNGTLQGGATANTVGYVGQAFSFDGTNGFVQIPDSPLLRPTNLTVETWVRFSALDSPGTSSAGQQYLVFKQNTRSSYFEGFFLGKGRGASGDFFVFGVSSASGQAVSVNSTPTIQTGVWYHVAGVRGSNYLQLYVNGQLMGQASVSFAQDYGNFPLYFGTSGQAYWNRKLKGNLDEVSLYNRALSSNEIAAIYAAGTAGKCQAASGPGITAQPQSLGVAVGSTALFTVTATGSAPLSYQWFFSGSSLANGGQFSGVGSSTLSINNAQPVNAGGYSVVVTNSLGSVTSAAAVLTVLVPPAITAQPQSVTGVVGTTAIFSATATGSAPLSYQWQLNGVNLANGTSTGVANTWEIGPSLPAAMTEMSCAWLGDKLYATGESNAYSPAVSSPTFVFNILSNTWSLLNPDRPYKGTHHAVEVFGGRMYLIGGLDGNSSGQVQIYDPVANSWSVGATAPYLAGSCASALINGKIYIAGGLVGVIAGVNNGYSTNAAAVYDPALNVWTRLPPLPFTVAHGMNHTASGTDGNKFYVFGGRDDDHQPAIGYNSVQIYDPASNTWVSSTAPGSTLSPLPQPRGGMGKAVYYNGDFYVMGGETIPGGTGATVDHVYNRVDIYNVASNTWRLGTPMPTARHGIFPVLRGNRIYVVGGGAASPFPTPPAYTSVFEIYVAASGGRITGATSNTLTITNVQATDAGNYTLVVSNPAGAVTSVVATLTVTGLSGAGQPASQSRNAVSGSILPSMVAPKVVESAPVIESIALSDGVVVITWNAVSNKSYRVQFTKDLGSTNWSDVLPVVLAAGPTAKASDPIGSSPQRFYRVILMP